MDKETKEEFEGLARMINKGFDSVTKQIKEVHLEVTGIRVDLAEHKKENGKRFDEIEKKIDQSWGLIDGYVKAQEDFRDEFKIMKHKMNQMEKIIESKLGVVLE